MRFLLVLLALVCAWTLPANALSAHKLGEGEVLVVLSEFTLYVRHDGELYEFPIAVGRPGAQKGIIGTWEVSDKVEWPRWTPTPNMLARNCKKYCKWRNGMKGGPHNPLGARALYLGNSTYRIHGTNEPGSIGRQASSGCIRMHNKDVIALYRMVHIGATVTVVRHQDRQADAEAYEPDIEDESSIALQYEDVEDERDDDDDVLDDPQHVRYEDGIY